MKNNSYFFSANLPKALTQEQTMELFHLMKSGNMEARDLLIKHNIKFVIYTANIFSRTQMDMEDLVATGIIGLIKSVDSFDVNLNVKFSTYSSVCIQNEIKMQLRSVKKAKREISMQEVYQPKSINCNAFTLEDILQDTTESIEDLFIDNDCTLEVRKLINILSPIEKCIILLHFGFIHNRVFSQSEIGSLLNLSQSYVSRIINRVVKKLKTQISSAEKNGNRFYKDFYGETNFDFEKFIEKFIEEKKERGLPYTLQK